MSNGRSSEVRGLALPDLFVLFAYHGGREKRPGFARSQIWLNRRNEGANISEIILWWNSLPEVTRRYVARGMLSQKLADNPRAHRQVGAAMERARRERNADWPPGPPDRRQSSESYWLQRVLLTWYLAEDQPTYRNARETIRVLAQIPRDAAAMLFADNVPPNLDAPAYADCPRIFESLSTAWKRHKRQAGVTAAGSATSRRRYWLELYESGSKLPEILDEWENASDEERRAIGGARTKRLAATKGRRQGALAYLRQEIWLGEWERELEGKPASYGRALWCLKQYREGQSPSEVMRLWGCLSLTWRKTLCPVCPEQFENAGQVSYAIATARRLAGDDFLARRPDRTFSPHGTKSDDPLGTLFHAWRKDGASYGQIRDRWVSMTREEQENLAPGCSDRKIDSGTRGKNLVGAICRSAAARHGERTVNRSRAMYHRDQLFLSLRKKGLGVAAIRRHLEEMPEQERQRLWPEFDGIVREMGGRGRANNIIGAALCRAAHEDRDVLTAGKADAQPRADEMVNHAGPAAPPAIAATNEPSMSGTEDRSGDRPLGFCKEMLLLAMLKLGLLDCDNRKTRLMVVRKAFGPFAEPNSYRVPLDELVSDGLVTTHRGRKGGVWLTSAGIDRAKHLQSRTTRSA